MHLFGDTRIVDPAVGPIARNIESFIPRERWEILIMRTDCVGNLRHHLAQIASS
jgi:hypothetical protein